MARPSPKGLRSGGVVEAVAKPSRSVSGKAIVKKLLSFGAMAGVGALLVSTSLPANAFQDPGTAMAEVAAPAEVEKQSVVVQSTSQAKVSRDSYKVVKPKPKPVPVYVSPVYGSYKFNPNGTIQWPFPSAPIASGYGPRGGSFHYGIDLFPGAGTPIGAIADGVVTYAGAGSGGFGNFVTVEHQVKGQTVQSLYAHMQWGSIGVAQGQHVTVGQFLGAVGQTGRAYGAHLHLEIKVNGAHVDPYSWLTTNAD